MKNSSGARQAWIGNKSTKCDGRLGMGCSGREPKASPRSKSNMKRSSWWWRKFFRGCAQVYSDKSQTSLSPSAAVFYHLHLTFSSFSEEQRRKFIEQALTVLAYLPLSFRRKPQTYKSSTLETKVSQIFKKEHQMEALHDCIEACSQPLAACAMAGITCKTSDKSKLKAHILLTS